MAAATPTSPFLSNASSLSSTPSFYFSPLRQTTNAKRQFFTLCKASSTNPEKVLTSAAKRRSFSLSLIVNFVFLAATGKRGNAAILEADDDEELLEKVKKDRKKRLERQGVINSSNKETGYLQELVYKLSKVGQAIDNNDLSAASSVLGGSTDADWVKKANIAFSKLSSSPEEKTEVDTFNASLASLISSVTKKDIELSKTAFVSSATALEKWTELTGIVERLKGL